MNGLLILDKPSGVTSRHVVDIAEGWFPGVKIGHAGTLDPLATGVLVLCLGSTTRLIEYVQDMEKTYVAELRLGARSDTDDADGTIEPVTDARAPELAQLQKTLSSFVGDTLQTPPAYSAARVGGGRAHLLARRGRDPRLEPRQVRINRIELRRYKFPDLELEIDCGKGTYIRSLARDLGERLGCGALVAALTRTRVGCFTQRDALDLHANVDTARRAVRPPQDAVAHLPALTLTDADLHRLRCGQILEGFPELPLGELAVFNERGELAAIAASRVKSTIKAKKML